VSSKSPRSLLAARTRRTDLFVAFPQLGTNLLRLQRSQVHVHAPAGGQQSQARLIAKKTHQSRDIHDIQRILPETIRLPEIASPSLGGETSSAKSVNFQYGFIGCILIDTQKSPLKNLHHLTSISKCRNFLPCQSTTFQINASSHQSLRGSTGLLS